MKTQNIDAARCKTTIAHLLVVWLCAFHAVGAPTAENPAFWLVRDGAPAATIVLAVEPLDSHVFAAEELQRALKLMSGAELPIASDADEIDGPRIAIGRSALTRKMDGDIPDGFSRKLDEEGFIIRTKGDLLILAGNDAGPKRGVGKGKPHQFTTTYKGSLFAVYELLERLGCRWYYPGDFGELIPSSRDVNVAKLDVLEKPSFPVRGFWYGVPTQKRKDAQLYEDMETWMLRCRFLPYSSVLASAGDGSVMGPFRKTRLETMNGEKTRVNILFEEHPEYFALTKDGSRNVHYLCLANTNVLRIATEHVLEHFRANPDSMCFGYAPPDGAPTCECSECKARNFGFMQRPPANPNVQDISDGFYWFLNEVAKGVEKEFPNKWVTTTAYSGRVRPPEGIALNGNISAHTAFLGTAQHHRYDFYGWQTRMRVKFYERWGKASSFMVERPYFPPMQFHCHVPQPLYRAHAFNLRTIRELGFRGSEWEGRCAFMAGGINYYVRGKCLWNADTDIDALLDEYYARCFGAAAEPVARFFEAVEKQYTTCPVDHHEEERLPEMYPHTFVVEVTDGVGDIEAMVAGADDGTRKRVRFARLVVDHFRAYSEMRAAEAEFAFTRAADKAREMIAHEREVEAMGTTLVDGTAENWDGRPLYGELGANASPHGKLKQYLAKQAMIDGTRGELVAALPVEWEFTKDERDDGLTFQWYLPGDHGQTWMPMKTTQSYEIQGLQDERLYGYNGFSWYRTTFDVPRKFKGRRLVLFIGGYNDHAWVWCNGRLAGEAPFHEYWQRWRYPAEVDITDCVRYGKQNTLAIRVADEQNFGGIFRRCFVYAPVGPPETAASTATADTE